MGKDFGVAIAFWVLFMVAYIEAGVSALLAGTIILQNYWSAPIPGIYWAVFIGAGIYTIVVGIITWMVVR